MTRNYTLNPDHRAERRRRVEYLKVRGLTIREIVKALKESGFVNPATGGPYSVEPIQRDVEWLRGEWARRHEEDIEVHIAAQLAAIREGIRVAWSRGDLTEARLYLKREAELLGLDAPKEARLTGPGGGPIQFEEKPSEAKQIREIDEHLDELEDERRKLEAELASLAKQQTDSE